jgi:hypothetical protein
VKSATLEGADALSKHVPFSGAARDLDKSVTAYNNAAKAEKEGDTAKAEAYRKEALFHAGHGLEGYTADALAIVAGGAAGGEGAGARAATVGEVGGARTVAVGEVGAARAAAPVEAAAGAKGPTGTAVIEGAGGGGARAAAPAEAAAPKGGAPAEAPSADIAFAKTEAAADAPSAPGPNASERPSLGGPDGAKTQITGDSHVSPERLAAREQVRAVVKEGKAFGPDGQPSPEFKAALDKLDPADRATISDVNISELRLREMQQNKQAWDSNGDPTPEYSAARDKHAQLMDQQYARQVAEAKQAAAGRAEVAARNAKPPLPDDSQVTPERLQAREEFRGVINEGKAFGPDGKVSPEFKAALDKLDPSDRAALRDVDVAELRVNEMRQNKRALDGDGNETPEYAAAKEEYRRLTDQQVNQQIKERYPAQAARLGIK